jgi:hypothetical protein
MATKPRKVKFYSLHQTAHDTNEKVPASIIRDVITYLAGLDDNARKYKISPSKVCYISTIAGPYNDMHSIVFKSTSTDFKPPVMDQDTLAERKNPKKDREGDREKTHLVIKYADNDVFIVLESNGNGLGINAVFKYLKVFTRKYKRSINERMDISLDFATLAKDDFMEEIRKMKRVVLGQVYVEKSILGSSALNYSKRTQSVQHEIVMNIKANREDTIRATIEDIYNKIGAKGSKITKIRVQGKAQNNGETVADTSFIEKMENVDVEINSFTGVVNTASILTELRNLANRL